MEDFIKELETEASNEVRKALRQLVIQVKSRLDLTDREKKIELLMGWQEILASMGLGLTDTIVNRKLYPIAIVPSCPDGGCSKPECRQLQVA